MSTFLGFQAENKAQQYLIAQGYEILERNFHSRFGEIDIVAKKEGIIHFLEVKYSKKEYPLERITHVKMQKIIKTIEFYSMRKKLDCDYQIDALLVCDEEIELIENISF
ncbi:MAG: YraN family protein [Sulfurospirillum sp.]|nr:YraN family protein [Sulfurospirillum sp.]